MARASPTPAGHRWPWADIIRQALAFALVGGLALVLFQLTSANLQSRGVHSGFDFLFRPATTPVHDSPIGWQHGVDTFGRAFVAGALNSLKLTVAAIFAATAIGILIGLARLSPNALARSLAAGYVEVMRNVPVLLHIVFWYGLILQLPSAREATPIGPLLLSNRGAFLFPTVDGLAVDGLIAMSPEFLALFIGIALYTAAFIGEIVRASVLSVDRGQWDAGNALALSRATLLRRVIAPQALRVGLPALSSEYMGIFKNSTLAVVVGYQEFMAISETMLTDTGQAIEVMAIVIAFYAAVSLVISVIMHRFEHRQRHWSVQ